MFFQNDEPCCDCALSDAHKAVAQTCNLKLETEDASKNAQALYRQLKLEEQIAKSHALSVQSKQSLQHTNDDFIRQMIRNIDTHNINYPKSFAKLTDDQNTNTILNAIANRAIHLNKNPLGHDNKKV